jgi:hypothetical protein
VVRAYVRAIGAVKSAGPSSRLLLSTTTRGRRRFEFSSGGRRQCPLAVHPRVVSLRLLPAVVELDEVAHRPGGQLQFWGVFPVNSGVLNGIIFFKYLFLLNIFFPIYWLFFSFKLAYFLFLFHLFPPVILLLYIYFLFFIINRISTIEL